MSFFCTEIPYLDDTAAYFAAIADLPWAAWLDSGGMGRYDILTAAPCQTILADETASGEVYLRMRGMLGEQIAAIDELPFAGGLLGYWGYDLARGECGLPVGQVPGELPTLALGLYDWALVQDRQRRTARVVSHGRHPQTAALLERVLPRLRAGGGGAGEFCIKGEIASNFTRETYRHAFDAIQGYLQAGDCYQVNLAQRFSVVAQGDPLAAYLELRRRSPAPYAAYLNLPQAQILCASPERFIGVRDGRVQTRPIKGTRPRHSDPGQDQALAEELRRHPKDRAENLMIVDLLRNDLGKCCVPGSVRVPGLFEVESYANVHHLVSTVEGTLAPGWDALDLLHACFPGGSITGAPKLRAMQIIDELEPHRREVYCGAIGYVGFDGNMDTNIVIRTLVHAGGQMRCWAGGGIVADSECETEYQETLHKASAMLAMLESFRGR